MESFACGVPVISTAVGGVPEFVKDKFGILIEKNNEKALYESMKMIIESKIIFEKPEVLRAFVLSGFSRESIAGQFSEIYTEILNKDQK